jgi:acetoin:2,6-dichlorophenolindophenol oxidoreductase subunit beta
MKKNYIFSEVVNLTLKEIMKSNNKTVLFGLGVDDPKGIFGTTSGLKEIYGNSRVFDMPASENAMTGVAIGMSLNKMIPIMNHQRMDFFLLAMDQLINNAAKWKYMFGGQQKAPIIIRLIVGRGWGQGPTHSQNFQNMFASIPGLKVYIPSFPSTVRNILHASIKSSDPVLIIEHRWLHYMNEKIDFKSKPKKISCIKKIKDGKDLTIISSSYSTFEILKLYDNLKKNNISIDHLDINMLKPFNIDLIYNSVKKTGKLLILDNSVHKYCSFGGHLISELVSKKKNIFKKEPINLNLPDIPSPTSYYLSKEFYNSSEDIFKEIAKLMNKKIELPKDTHKHDIPDPKFRGPF